MRVEPIKAIIFCFFALVSFYLGFFAFEVKTAVNFARHGDYWLFLGLTVWIAVLLLKTTDLSSIRTRLFDRNIQIASLIVFLGWAYLQVHEIKEYKTMIDEPMQVGASMMMHQHREAASPIQVHRLNGSPEIIDSVVDKRPQYFPFLVSLVHDILGYRIENGFLVNAALSALLLILLFRVAHKIGGYPGAYTALVLLLGIPEFYRAANGAGFEVLNLLLILSFLFFAWKHLESHSEKTQDMLCIVGVLAAYSRYESIIIIFGIACVILLVWRKTNKILLSKALVVAPILLVPYLWRYRVFSTSESIWQLSDRPGASAPFSLSYVYDNLGHALNYYLSLSDQFANSVFVSVTGMIGIIFTLLVLSSRFRLKAWDNTIDTGFLIFCIFIAAHFLLMMSYFFGQFDDFIVSRLSLPYYLLLVLAPVYAISNLKVSGVGAYSLLMVALLGFFAYGMPKISRHNYSKDYHPANELHFARRFLEYSENQHLLMISRMPILWATLEVDTTSIQKVNMRLDRLKLYLEEKTNPPVFLYELVQYDVGRKTLQAGLHRGYPAEVLILDERVEVEEVMTEMVTPIHGQRISRVKSVRDVESIEFTGETAEEYILFRTINLP
ncbi:MAG: glycosyltransferase family 39 protein [Verrucomicrobiota bacterium]